MKIRSLLTVVALLSVMLFGIGTAHAILGVEDNVPGQDFVFPVICATPQTGNGENTLFAIPETLGTAVNAPDLAGNVAYAHCQLKTTKSVTVLDFDMAWTPFDVVTGDCNSLVTPLTAGQKASLTVTVGGLPYYAGYIFCQQVQVPGPLGFPTALTLENRFIPYNYLVDLQNGFASGFSGPRLEDGSADGNLGENGDNDEVTANTIYARYFLNNDNANTFNWWILLLGRNQYNVTNVISSTRKLTGTICNEEEGCLSIEIPIPDELDIINVVDHLPGGLHTQFPKAGFALLTITESGAVSVAGPFTITGTANNNNALSPDTNPFYSLYGWSYQRAFATNASLSWDVIHSIDRIYCSGATGAVAGFNGVGQSGNFPNDAACTCVGGGC